MAGVSIRVYTGALAQPAAKTTIKEKASKAAASLAAAALLGKGLVAVSSVNFQILIASGKTTCVSAWLGTRVVEAYHSGSKVNFCPPMEASYIRPPLL